jgi:hypothetical protein
MQSGDLARVAHEFIVPVYNLSGVIALGYLKSGELVLVSKAEALGSGVARGYTEIIHSSIGLCLIERALLEVISETG